MSSVIRGDEGAGEVLLVHRPFSGRLVWGSDIRAEPYRKRWAGQAMPEEAHFWHVGGRPGAGSVLVPQGGREGCPKLRGGEVRGRGGRITRGLAAMAGSLAFKPTIVGSQRKRQAEEWYDFSAI